MTGYGVDLGRFLSTLANNLYSQHFDLRFRTAQLLAAFAVITHDSKRAFFLFAYVRDLDEMSFIGSRPDSADQYLF